LGVLVFERGHQVKSFTGRLSLNDKLITDRATGIIHEERTQTTARYHGTILFLMVTPEPGLSSSSLLLECLDGFKIMIDLDDLTQSGGSQFVSGSFLSNGPQLE
jgi:hypothetical protein